MTKKNPSTRWVLVEGEDKERRSSRNVGKGKPPDTNLKDLIKIRCITACQCINERLDHTPVRKLLKIVYWMLKEKQDYETVLSRMEKDSKNSWRARAWGLAN